MFQSFLKLKIHLKNENKHFWNHSTGRTLNATLGKLGLIQDTDSCIFTFQPLKPCKCLEVFTSFIIKS